jgi:hypothetical protein
MSDRISKQKQHQLIDKFTKEIASWSQLKGLNAEDAANRFINVVKLLKEFMKDDPKNKCFTAVVGDESAGKSVLCMALLKQVILDVKQGTATTVRTHIVQTCNLTQTENFQCSLTYNGRDGDKVDLAAGNPKQLLDKYGEVSEKNKARHERDNTVSKIDGENICNIAISSKDPNLGLEIMDHAGFAAQDSVLIATTQAFKNTMNDYFIGKKNNATMLLCHAVNLINEARSKSVYPKLEEFHSVDEGKLFLVVTKMDKLASEEALDCFATFMLEQTREDKRDQSRATDADGRPVYKPSEILDFIKYELAERVNTAGRSALPNHVKVYFVASFHGKTEELAACSDDPKERFNQFLNDDRKGQVVAERNAFDPNPQHPGVLFDVEKWKRAGISLKDATDPEEINKVRQQCGMENLFQDLLQRQAGGVEEMASELAKQIKGIMRQEWRDLLAAFKDFSDSPDVVHCTNLILEKFVESYCVMSQNELYKPGASGYAKQDTNTEIDQNMVAQWQQKKMTLGWSLQQDSVEYEKLARKAVFPPEVSKKGVDDEKWNKYRSLRIEGYQQFYDENVSYCVQKPDVQERNLTALVRRALKDYALKSCGIRVPDVDADQLCRDAKMNVYNATADVKSALVAHINDTYSEIYGQTALGGTSSVLERDREGGTTYIASKIALCSIQHAQIVLELLKDVPHFEAVFGKDGVGRWKGEKRELSLLGDRLNKKSRVQNLNHPGNVMQTQQPSPSHYHYAETESTLRSMVAKALEAAQVSKKPVDDIFDIIIAQFHDKPFEELESMMNNLSTKCTVSSSAYQPLSLHLGPLFLHEDESFTQEYKQHNPKDNYVHSFIGGAKNTEHLKEFFETISTWWTNSDLSSSGAKPLAQIVPLVKDNPYIKAIGVAATLARMAGDAVNNPADDAPTPQKYPHENGQLFQGMSEDAKRQIILLNTFEPLTPKDRACLLSSMINADKLPDAINAFENSESPGFYEVNWMNFVKKRHLSCAVKRTLDDVLQSVTAQLYEYMHPRRIEVLSKEAWNRWESLVMGYPYAYVQSDRPSMYRYLNTDEVIQFLYRNRKQILLHCASISQLLAVGTQAPVDDSQQPASSQELELPELDYKIHQSPLFQCVCKLAAEDPHGAEQFIIDLYAKWKFTVSGNGGDGDSLQSQARKDLTKTILNFLLKRRFGNAEENSDLKNNRRKQLVKRCCHWYRVQASVLSFVKFVKENKTKFVGSAISPEHIGLHPELEQKFHLAEQDNGLRLEAELRKQAEDQRIPDDDEDEEAGPSAKRADALVEDEIDYGYDRLRLADH